MVEFVLVTTLPIYFIPAEAVFGKMCDLTLSASVISNIQHEISGGLSACMKM